MAAELPEAGMVAHCVAIGRAAILEPLLSFLEGALARGPVLELDAAILFVTLTLPMAYLAGVILLYPHVTAEAGTLLVLLSVASSLFPSACVRIQVRLLCRRRLRSRLETALGFMERLATTRRRYFTDVLLVPVVSLALLVLIAHLLLAIVVFVIERGDVTPELKQAAAALSAGVLGWLRNLASIKLTIAFRILGFEIDMMWDILLADRN